MSVGKFLTIKEVAKKLRVSERSVIRYIKAKKLVASKVGQWRIKESDFKHFFKINSNNKGRSYTKTPIFLAGEGF